MLIYSYRRTDVEEEEEFKVGRVHVFSKPFIQTRGGGGIHSCQSSASCQYPPHIDAWRRRGLTSVECMFSITPPPGRERALLQRWRNLGLQGVDLGASRVGGARGGEVAEARAADLAG